VRTAQQVRPNDFWINHELFELLYDKPAQKEEAITFLRVALANTTDGRSLSSGHELA
jgi:hypothetical protein